MHFHDWFYYEAGCNSYRRCNRCGIKQKYWRGVASSGWSNVFKPYEREQYDKIKAHNDLLLREIAILKAR